jgi:predicted tellurium resistance membrane protein TerC
MRLDETATVSKFERQKALCVGVVVVLVLRLFFAFFEISHWRAVGRP